MMTEMKGMFAESEKSKWFNENMFYQSCWYFFVCWQRNSSNRYLKDKGAPAQFNHFQGGFKLIKCSISQLGMKMFIHSLNPEQE